MLASRTSVEIACRSSYFQQHYTEKDKFLNGDGTVKSTGIVRKVDELGRVVIPIELRRTLGIGEKDALEIYVDGDRIILKKYEPACIFCGQADEIIHFKGKNICPSCITEMQHA